MFDCQRCGACCYGPDHYIDLLPADLLRLGGRTAGRYAVAGGRGRASMQMVHAHCAALLARQGHFWCRIYGRRPDACRRVEVGTPECLRARARRGLAA
ncbi:MAG TPA: YkgJ family cysteine cluster protein [Polyangia bacterium]|nr:YkgJ family cysteine cluster protein [Polyangia bacterium]